MTPAHHMLGLDPGPSWLGFCLLRAGQGIGRPTFEIAGNEESLPGKLESLFQRCHELVGPFTVAIESVKGYSHEYVRSAALHDTSEIAGLIRGICVTRGLSVIRIPAIRWRSVVCGKSNADDALVKRAIRVLVADWPTRSNVHMRDAAGVAFAALSPLPRATTPDVIYAKRSVTGPSSPQKV